MTDKSTANKKLTWWLLAIILIIILVVIFWYSKRAKEYPTTDDTYVQAHIINIAPQVSGSITKIFVKDHALVKHGQSLFNIDNKPYEYTVEKATAQLELSKEQGRRIFPLIKSGKIAPAEGDQITAHIQQASAELKQAQYNLKHTTITAPADGRIADFKIRVGDTVSKGINLFAIVEQQDFWVNANFKETQLQRIKVGQTAKIKVDMYPRHIFKGIVQSVSPGSGTIFSLLPPENATGNWVKITQRIPVKIDMITPDPRYPLRAGSSAKAIVDTVSPIRHNES